MSRYLDLWSFFMDNFFQLGFKPSKVCHVLIHFLRFNLFFLMFQRRKKRKSLPSFSTTTSAMISFPLLPNWWSLIPNCWWKRPFSPWFITGCGPHPSGTRPARNSSACSLLQISYGYFKCTTNRPIWKWKNWRSTNWKPGEVSTSGNTFLVVCYEI